MDEQRVRRIEEAVSFTEQRADTLDEVVREVADRLTNLVDRLGALESRLAALERSEEPEGAVEETDPALDRPPHSGRLPGDR